MNPARPQFPDESGSDGEFVRQEDAFRDWVEAGPRAPHPPAKGRYHLYISLACPWASRAFIVRRLKELEDYVGVSIADPIRGAEGWAFRPGPGHGPDEANGFQFLREAYIATDPGFKGRITVPVLWDNQTRKIVNNSEDDICRMFNDVFASVTGRKGPDLFPPGLVSEQEPLSDYIYGHVNNAVYEAGFATRQQSYERAAWKLFAALDALEERLSGRAFLLGDRPVETDWRLFCTLIRFDPVYHGHFKCNLRRIADYPNLFRYTRDLYRMPGIAGTVNFDHIKRHYYMTHEEINPTRIVPIGPEQNLAAPP